MQELLSAPREDDQSDGASAIFGDAEAEDKRGYQGDAETNNFDTTPPKTPEDIPNKPKSLYGKSKEEISSILDDGWTEGAYGSQKQG